MVGAEIDAKRRSDGEAGMRRGSLKLHSHMGIVAMEANLRYDVTQPSNLLQRTTDN